MNKGINAPVSSAKLLLAVFVALLVMSSPLAALADGSTVVLEATGSGFVEDELFINWGDNLGPGDAITKAIKIVNNHSRVVLLSMRAEVVEGDNGFLDKIWLVLKHGDEVIYEGPVSGNQQPDGTGDYAEGIDLGSIQAGETYELAADIYLDGEKIGNEFQGKSGIVKWIFTGQFDEDEPSPPSRPSRPRRPDRTPVDEPIVVEPEEPVYTPPEELVELPEEPPVGEPPGMPKTGEGLPYPYYLAGACAIVAGIGLLRNKSKS